MSSTNRSKARLNHQSDYYITPIIEIEKFLHKFSQIEPQALSGIILDPCAGGDKENAMSYPSALIKQGINANNIHTMDIRSDSLASITGDYLNTKLPIAPNTIITNPPFFIAQSIIEKALNDVANDGYVIMLLRLNFFGGQKRNVFWKKQMADYCFIHPKRISFTNDKKTDSIEYAHFIWKKNSNPSYCKTYLL